jgi:hypothetical protein
MRTTSRISLPGAPYSVEAIEEALRPHEVTQDSSLVSVRDGVLRIAAIDGVTPSPDTPSRFGLDGAAAAASVVRACLLAPVGITAAISAASADLYTPGLSLSANSAACVAAADISLSDGVVEIVRAGDCEAYAQAPDGSWRALFGRAASEWADEACRAAGWPFISTPEYRRIWDTPGAWLTNAVGSVPVPVVEQVRLDPDDWSCLIVASDGAHLDAERASRLDEHLASLCGDCHEGPGYLSHGDITIVRVRRI